MSDVEIYSNKSTLLESQAKDYSLSIICSGTEQEKE